MRALTFIPGCELQRRVASALSSAHFVVETTVTARECLDLIRFVPYESVLIDSDSLLFADIALLVKLLREESHETSLFVFARYLDLGQRLQLFEAGADDCVRQPFFASELAVRLSLSIRLRQAASKSGSANTVNVLRSCGLELDLVRRRVSWLGKTIVLRPKEFLLLEYLVRNENRTVTRTMILDHVWNSSFEGMVNIVDVYISSLRRKLDPECPERFIQTQRGVGYTFSYANSLRVGAGPSSFPASELGI